VQALEKRSERGEIAPTEGACPVLLYLRNDLARHCLSLGAPRGEANELGATIGGVWNPLDVTQALEIVHEVDDARLADLGELGELCHPGPAIGDVLPDRSVGRPKIPKPAAGERFAHKFVQRESRVAQQRADVCTAGPATPRT
jgi:hypothetical protein